MAKRRLFMGVCPDTAKLIREECVRMYLKHHPEMRKMRITDDKILYEMALFYLQE